MSDQDRPAASHEDERDNGEVSDGEAAEDVVAQENHLAEIAHESTQDDAHQESTDQNGTAQDGTAQPKTRWQRITKHPAFKPVLTIGGVLTLGGVMLLTSRSGPTVKPQQLSAGLLEKIAELAQTASAGGSESVARTSPIQHGVSGYQRLQRVGPGRAETKVVHIAPYQRGGKS